MAIVLNLAPCGRSLLTVHFFCLLRFNIATTTAGLTPTHLISLLVNACWSSSALYPSFDDQLYSIQCGNYDMSVLVYIERMIRMISMIQSTAKWRRFQLTLIGYVQNRLTFFLSCVKRQNFIEMAFYDMYFCLFT